MMSFLLQALDSAAAGGQPVRLDDETPWPEIKATTGDALLYNTEWMPNWYWERLALDFETQSAQCPLLGTLLQKLLKFGGYDLDSNPGYYDVQQLLTRGMFFKPDNIQMKSGRKRYCHANVAKLVLKHPHRFLLVSGFALNSDTGFWIPHTWALNMGYEPPRLVETTGPFLLYFGCIYLTGEMINLITWELYMEHEGLPESVISAYENLLASTAKGVRPAARRRKAGAGVR